MLQKKELKIRSFTLFLLVVLVLSSSPIFAKDCTHQDLKVQLICLTDEVERLSQELKIANAKISESSPLGKDSTDIRNLEIFTYKNWVKGGSKTIVTKQHFYCSITEYVFNFGGTTGNNKACEVTQESSGVWKLTVNSEQNQTVSCVVACF